jgi:hypothetical protein
MLTLEIRRYGNSAFAAFLSPITELFIFSSVLRRRQTLI